MATENLYVGDGSTVLYSFTFPYINEADVKVSLNQLNTTAFTLSNATTVEFNTAPSTGVSIRIYRDTPTDTIASVFFPGSAIRAQDLNDNFEQALYVVQESQAIIENSDAASVTVIANQALSTANQASSTANAVSGTANTALTTANSAETTANQALTDAGVANNTAVAAKVVADAALNSGSVISDLSDVSGTAPTSNQVLAWSGSQWLPVDQPTQDTLVQKSGDTMTGGLTVPSLNGGQLAGFRNIIINGRKAVNQRGLTYAAVSVGEYWADRWKKTAGGNMVQIIEEGSYIPNLSYTLSGIGVTTQQVTSPTSGNWTTPDIPNTANNIQLEPGDVATPYENRANGLEITLCQRYYCKVDGDYRFDAKTGTPTFTYGAMWYFPVTMRVPPTVTTAAENGQESGPISWDVKSTSGAEGFWEYTNGTSTITRTKGAILEADAEL